MGLLKTIGQFAVGAGKAALRSATELSSLAQLGNPNALLARGAQALGEKVAEKITGKEMNTVQPTIRQAYEKLPEEAKKAQGGAQKAGFVTEQVAEFAVPFVKGAKLAEIVKTPLTKLATSLYRSALKPSTGKKLTNEAARAIAETGVKERVFINNGGIEKLGGLIDDLDTKIGAVIEEKAKEGVGVPLAGLQKFADETKKLFTAIADIDARNAFIKEIDVLFKKFAKVEGGKNASIPIDRAQEIKRATMRHIRNSYGKLTGANEEGQKQIARFLRIAIEDLTEGEAGEINRRITSLVKLQEYLEPAVKRSENAGIVGAETGIVAGAGAALGGVAGVGAATVASTVFKLGRLAGVKSGAAIGVDAFGGLVKSVANSRGQVPVLLLIEKILANALPKGQSNQEQTKE